MAGPGGSGTGKGRPVEGAERGPIQNPLQREILESRLDAKEGEYPNPDKNPAEQAESLKFLKARSERLIKNLMRKGVLKKDAAEKYGVFKEFVKALNLPAFREASDQPDDRLTVRALQVMSNRDKGQSSLFWSELWPDVLRQGIETTDETTTEEAAGDTSKSLDELKLRLGTKTLEKPKGVKEALDHQKNPLEQQEALVLSGIRAKILLLELTRAKIINEKNIGDVMDFAGFMAIAHGLDRAKVSLSDDARQALVDLAGLSRQESSLHDFWTETWPGIVVVAQELKKDVPEEEKNKWSTKVKKFYEGHRLSCNLAGLGLLAGGLYWLFRRKKDTSEEGLKKSVSSSWLLPTGIIAGIGAAAYFGWDYVKKFLGINEKDLGLLAKAKEQAEKLRKANETRKTEGVKAAGLDWLTDGQTEPMEWHRKLSAKLKEKYKEEIDPRAMAFLGTISYEQFRKEYATGRISQALGSIGDAIKYPGVDKAVAAVLSSSAANMNRLFETLEESEDLDAKAMEGKPLSDVLKLIHEKLDKNELKAKTINRDAIDIAGGVTHGVAESYRSFAEDFLSDTEGVANMLGNGAIRDTIEGWRAKINAGEFELTDTYSMPADIMRACWENGVPLAIGAGTMAVWTGTKWWIMARATPLVEAAKELVSNGLWPGDWKMGEAFKVYGIASSPLVVLGMTKGALFSSGARLRGMVWEGAKGFMAPVKVVELGYDATYHVPRALEYGTAIKRSVVSFARHNFAGKSVRTLGKIPLLRRLSTPEAIARIQQNYMVERIIALETQQRLLQEKIGKKFGPIKEGEWERKVEHIAEKIKSLKRKYGQLGGIQSSGHDVGSVLEKAIEGAKGECLGKMYKELSGEAIKTIQGSHELREIFLTEGYGNPVIRRALRMKNPEGFLKMLSANEEIIRAIRINPAIARASGFERLITMAERLPAETSGLLMEAMAKNPELAKTLLDPAVLRNKQFMIDLEQGIRQGTFVAEEAGQTGEKVLKLEAELIKTQAMAARQPSVYARFKKAVAEAMEEGGKRVKSTRLGKRVGEAVDQGIARVKGGFSASNEAIRTRLQSAYQKAAEQCKLRVIDPTKQKMGALKTWSSQSAAARELERLKAKGGAQLNGNEIMRRRELEQIVQREIESAGQAIVKDPKLAKAWQEYKLLVARAQTEGAGLRAMNEAEFLKYRTLWSNAAKLGGVAFLIVLIHGFESAENKGDYLAKTSLEVGAFGVGLKLGMRGGALLGAKMPGPIYAKAACVVLGAVAGYAGSEIVGGAYNWASAGVLDRWWINRGRGGHWAAVGNVADVAFGAGINNVAELLDYNDTGIMNIDEEDLFIEPEDGDEDGEPIPNPMYYQQYLAASSVHLTEWRRAYYRDAGKFDQEIEQLAVRLEAEVKELEEKRDGLLSEEDPKKIPEEKLAALEKQIDRKYAEIKIIREQLKIRDNPVWVMQQELFHANIKKNLEAFKPEFIKRFSERLGEQTEVVALLDHLEERLLSGKGDLIQSEREQALWVRLRDQTVTATLETDAGETESKTMAFKDWFLQLRRYAKSYSTFEQIRDHGRLGAEPEKTEPEPPQKEEPPSPVIPLRPEGPDIADRRLSGAIRDAA